ncbi:hypothetical protein ACYUJ6_12395 [Clostridium sp. JNZ X4-2]
MITLRIIGIVILLFTGFIVSLIVFNTKYKIKCILKENTLDYYINAKLFFGIISVIGTGRKGKTKIFIKVLFLKKRININSKKDKDFEYNASKLQYNILDKIKKVYVYKKPIEKIIFIIKPKYVKIEGNYGLNDPFIIGMLGGLFAVIGSIFPKKSVNMKPDFFNEILNFCIEAAGSFRIISLISIVIKLLSSHFVKKRLHKKHTIREYRLKKSKEIKVN